MVKRGENYFVPTGKTSLREGDHLMVLTDNKEGLDATLRALGASGQTAPEPARRKWWSIFFEDE